MNEKKLLEKVRQSPNNVRSDDFVKLIESFGFAFARQKGSHRIFERANVPELVNIQNVKGKAKAYQVWQFLEKVERFNLTQEQK
ncbi:MAG: type II toxin-antitoxin system HicA family toxin [Rhizobacter sp.]|nr:type II toxin-antitoxin system HicA family toxin [Chlorobiales bacterium]